MSLQTGHLSEDPHPRVPSSENAHQPVLCNDLLSIAQCMMVGAASVAKRSVPGSEGNVWVVKGPDENLVVMLHYKDEPSLLGKEGAGDARVAESDRNADRELNRFSTRTRQPFFNAMDEMFVVDSTAVIKSEPVDDASSCRASNDIDRTLTSSSSISEDNEGCSLDQRVGDLGICLGNFVKDELEPNTVTDGSLQIVMKECSVALQSLDVAALKRLETRSDATTSADKRKTQSQNYQRCRYCSKVFQNVPILKFHEKFACQQVKKHDERTREQERSPSRKRELRGCKLMDTGLTRASKTLSENTRSGTKDKPQKRRSQHRNVSDVERNVSGQRSSRDRAHRCSFCGKTFKTHGRTKAHEKTHATEKPHQCSFCEKKFIRLYHRIQHERTHTGEKPYPCSFCDRKFSILSRQKRHESRHTGEEPYQCSFCEKKFIRRDNAVRHERTHTGEKPYPCSYCCKKFSQVHNQRAHERTHTGEKPYRCSRCDRKFTKLRSKVVHEKTHTGEES